MALRARGALILLVALASSSALAQQAVFVARHAEKLVESDNSAASPLSRQGEERARRLAALLRDAGIRAIYTSEYPRAILTAEPLALALKVKPVPYGGDSGSLVRRLRDHHRDDVVLIVGHGNTVPEILKLLGHTVPVTIAPNEYDNLFMVVPRAGTSPTVLRLRY